MTTRTIDETERVARTLVPPGESSLEGGRVP